MIMWLGLDSIGEIQQKEKMETNEKRRINKIDLRITRLLHTSSDFGSGCDLKLSGESELLSGGK